MKKEIKKKIEDWEKEKWKRFDKIWKEFFGTTHVYAEAGIWDEVKEIIIQEKQKWVEEIEYRLNNAKVMIKEGFTPKEIADYLTQVLEALTQPIKKSA